MGSFSYGANIALPATSDVDPKYEGVARELTMLMQAARTLAVYIDQVSGRAIYSQAEASQLLPSQTLVGGAGYGLYVRANEAIGFGAMVNLFNNAGVINARNARNSSLALVAGGYCLTDNVVAGTYFKCTVGPGLNTGFTGLTPGSWYYLGDTATGQIQPTRPASAGRYVQLIGQAINATSIMVGSLNNWIPL